MSARPIKSLLAIKEGSAEDIALSASSARPFSADTPVDFDRKNIVPLLGAEETVAYQYQDLRPGSGFDFLQRGAEHNTTGPNVTISWFRLNLEGSYYGSVVDGVVFRKVGYTKAKHIQRFSDTIGSALVCVVFVGDDGQGDCEPGASNMRRFVRSGGMLGLKAAFIHRLPCATLTSSYRPCRTSESSKAEAPVFLFDTYLDAAVIARKHGFISEGGLHRVTQVVNAFFYFNCDPEGKETRAPETITMQGCAQLFASLRSHGIVAPTQEDIPDSRALRRFRAFCDECCGAIPSGKYHVDGVACRCDKRFRASSKEDEKRNTQSKLRATFSVIRGKVSGFPVDDNACEMRCGGLNYTRFKL